MFLINMPEILNPEHQYHCAEYNSWFLIRFERLLADQKGSGLTNCNFAECLELRG